MLVFLAVSAYADPLVAIVVVDPEARDQGYAVELEDLVIDDVLPVDVAVGEHVRIVDPDGGRHELDVAPGEAWEVSGPHGEAWMSRLGEEVRTDVLLVQGDADAVKAMADALGAEVRVEGERTLLVRHDILFDAPWVRARGLDHLDRVGFVRVDEDSAPPARTPTLAAPVATRAAVAVAAAPQAAGTPAPAVTPVRPAALGSAAGSAVGSAATPAASDVLTPPVQGTAEEAPTATPTGHKSRQLDPEPYGGRLYLCAMGGPLWLDYGGAFSTQGVTGEWYVSAPGVVHLEVKGKLWARAAIEVDRKFCRAVW